MLTQLHNLNYIAVAWAIGDYRSIASFLVFLTVASLTYFFVEIVFRRRNSDGLPNVEVVRRERLRTVSGVFRVFEPAIVELSRLFGSEKNTEKEDLLGDAKAPWRKSEAIAAGLLLGLLFGSIALAFSLANFPPIAAPILFGVTFGISVMGFYSQIESIGIGRKKSLVKRLPYIVDLMALVQEAGGSFQDALRAAAKENSDHPIGEELNEVANRIERGITQSDALQQFSNRYADDNIRYFVSSINQGVDLGVPLVQILRNQSDEMLRRRSQWIEKASAEAKVKISGPGFIIALACMMIVVSPFILQVVGTFK